MIENKRQFLTGSEIAVLAAIDSGAEMMYGYPITPTTEVFTGWIKNGRKYLQTEDEMAAGFGICGAVMAGQKAFTATAGPGHVLMQDPISMAEGMRLPFVAVVGQRGGPSSGTVIYSQQEVILACRGANGEGMRFVYSPSNLEELYSLTRQAFNDAWRYRFPAIVLTDGYLLKTRATVQLDKTLENIDPSKLVPEDGIVHWPNIYTLEEELYVELTKSLNDFNEASKAVASSELFEKKDAEIMIIAHGIVAASAKEAVVSMRAKGKKVGLFRPVTLSPLDKDGLEKALEGVQKVVFVESSAGQFELIIRGQLKPGTDFEIFRLSRPGLGIETDEIIKLVESL